MNRLVTVGVADSGVHPGHAQVGPVAGGVGIRVVEGEVVTDDHWRDHLGHGTAVAATIKGHAPRAALYSIRIFRRRLDAPVEALLYALQWAAERRLDLLNLSLGCADDRHEGAFVEACAHAREAGTMVVSAVEVEGRRSLPGRLASVLAVRPDRALEAQELRYGDGAFSASAWARPLGPLPRERNFHGASLAVAHVTGMAARLLEEGPLEPLDLLAALRRRAA